MYPCREAFQGLLNMTKHGRIPSDVEHYSSTLIVYAVVIYYGATIQQLGKVFTVLGGFSTTAIGKIILITSIISEPSVLRDPLILMLGNIAVRSDAPGNSLSCNVPARPDQGGK